MADDPFQTSEETGDRPKRRSWLLTCGIIFGIGCLLICGGVIFLATQFQGSATKDPVEITKIASVILDVQPPEGFEPEDGMDTTIFGFNLMKVAVFRKDQNMFMLMGMPLPYDPANTDQASAQMKQQQQAQGGQQGMRKITVEKTVTEEVTINGKNAPFNIDIGKDQNEADVTQIVGFFPTSGGTFGMLMMQIDGADMNEEQAIAWVKALEQGGE